MPSDAPAAGPPPAAGVWSAPGRVNLIGEHTDYNDGFALPFALPLRTVVRARRREGRLVTASSVGHDPVRFTVPGAPGEVNGWGGYVAGVAWALHAAGLDVPGADLTISSDVPVGAGLSSSHSLECAVALSLCGLAGVEMDRTELALLVQRAENDYVGAPTGLLDQMAVLHSVADHLSFFDARERSVRHVPLDLAAVGLDLMVIDTRAPHRLVDGAYAERRRSCEVAARRLGVLTLREVTDPDAALAALADDPLLARRARYILGENARVLEVVRLVETEQLAAIGPVLTASHTAAREDFENSVPEVDLAVDRAVAAGALGARMTGGGFGGAVIALVPTEAIVAVQTAVASAYRQVGYAEPTFLTLTPARGAGPGE